MSKRKKIIIFLLLFLCFTPYICSAFDPLGFLWEKVTAPALSVIVKGINFVLSLLVALSYFFAGVAAGTLKWAISLDVPLTHCPKSIGPNCVINVGWTLVRDFSNILLILIFIVIAFASILGFETYGMRRLLPKLLLVALIINFSQLICGIVVDIASVFMDVFFGKNTGIVDKLSEGPLTSLNGILQNWYNTDTFNLQTQEAFFVQSFVALLFGFGLAFVLGIYVLIFLMRIPVLWALTILSPLAFVSMILPGPPGFPFARHFWEEWISQFLQWTFIGIFAMFFLWLGVHLVYNLGSGMTADFNLSSLDIESKTTTAQSGGDFNRFFQNIMSYFVLLAFLSLGAMFTFRTNVWFAGAIMAVGQGIYARYISPPTVSTRLARFAETKVGRPVAKAVKEAITERAKRLPLLWEKMPEKLKGIPYKIPGVEIGYEEYKKRVAREEKEKFEKARKEVRVYSLSGLPDFIAKYKKYKPLSREAERRALAGVERLLREGKYEDIKKKLGAKETSKLVNAYIKRMEEMGEIDTIKEVIKKNPQLLSDKEGISKARDLFEVKEGEMYTNPLDKFFAGLKRRDYEDISTDALKKHPEVLNALLQRVDVDGLVTLASRPEVRDIIQKRWAEIAKKEERERSLEEQKILERAEEMWKEHEWRLGRAGYLPPMSSEMLEKEIEEKKQRLNEIKADLRSPEVLEERKAALKKEKAELEKEIETLEKYHKRMLEIEGKVPPEIKAVPFESHKEIEEAKSRLEEIEKEKKKYEHIPEEMPEKVKKTIEERKKVLEEEEKLLKKRIELTEEHKRKIEEEKIKLKRELEELETTLKTKGEKLAEDVRIKLEEEIEKTKTALKEKEEELKKYKPEEKIKGILGRIKRKEERGKRM